MKSHARAQFITGGISVVLGIILIFYDRDFPTNGMITHTAFYVALSFIGTGVCCAALAYANSRSRTPTALLLALVAIPSLLLGLAGADAVTDLRLGSGSWLTHLGFIVAFLVYLYLLASCIPQLNDRFVYKRSNDRRLAFRQRPINLIPSGLLLAALAIFSLFVDPDLQQSGMFTHAQLYVELSLLAVGVLDLWLGIAVIKDWKLVAGAAAPILPPFLLGCAASDALKDLQMGSPATIGWYCLLMLFVCVWQLTDVWLLLRPRRREAGTVAADASVAPGADRAATTP